MQDVILAELRYAGMLLIVSFILDMSSSFHFLFLMGYTDIYLSMIFLRILVLMCDRLHIVSFEFVLITLISTSLITL